MSLCYIPCTFWPLGSKGMAPMHTRCRDANNSTAIALPAMLLSLPGAEAVDSQGHRACESLCSTGGSTTLCDRGGAGFDCAPLSTCRAIWAPALAISGNALLLTSERVSPQRCMLTCQTVGSTQN